MDERRMRRTDRQSKDLAEVLARASGRALEEVRQQLGSSAPPAPAFDGKASARAQRAEHTARVLERAEADDSTTESERPRARPLDPTGRRGAFVSELQASGRGRMRPLDWTGDDYAAAEAIARSARAAERALCSLPGEFARRVQLAALAYERAEDGRRLPTRTWAHVRARRIVALGVILWRCSRSSRRRGMARIVVGRTRGMFASLFRNVLTGERLSVSSLFATQHHDEGGRWDCGDMVALTRAGAVWKAQPPASRVSEAFCGVDRHGHARAFNEYHLSRRTCAIEHDRPRLTPDLAGVLFDHLEQLEQLEATAPP